MRARRTRRWTLSSMLIYQMTERPRRPAEEKITLLASFEM
jgi:hypothetical protein